MLVPSYAEVGSAAGFPRAPIAYEIVRSSLQRLDRFEAAAARRLYAATSAATSNRAHRSPTPPSSPRTETSTVVTRLFDARINPYGYIELTRREG